MRYGESSKLMRSKRPRYSKVATMSVCGIKESNPISSDSKLMAQE